MRKKILSLFLTLLLVVQLTATAFAADTVLNVTADKTLPSAGETFDVTVAISGNPGFSAVQFSLAFDSSVVECTSISKGDILQGTFGAERASASGGAVLAAASSRPITKDGVLASCTFKVLKDGDPAFSLKNVVLSYTDGSPISYKISIPYHEAPEIPAPEVTPPAEEEPELPMQLFSDVPSDYWAASFVEKAVELGLITGYNDGTFRPKNQVTRAQFVTMLWRMAGKPESSGETPFTDTSALSAEFKAAIAWAYEKGYIGGRTATTFAPADPLSRQAAMKVLFLYSGGKSGTETLFTDIYDDQFTDSSTLASWAKAPMYWAVYNKLITGTTTTTLGATQTATRAQLAKILVNYAETFHS